jgi:hypothetical protein
MQLKIKTPIANRHQIDAPRFFRLAIHADTNWKRLTPAHLDVRRALRADKHIGIDVANFNQ